MSKTDFASEDLKTRMRGVETVNNYMDIPRINSFDMTLDSLVNDRQFWCGFSYTISGNPIPNDGLLMIYRHNNAIYQRIFGLGGEMKSRTYWQGAWSEWR